MQLSVDTAFATELAQLESLGFAPRSRCLRLLNKTNGNVEVVAKFLEAQKAFRDVARQEGVQKRILKRQLKEIKKSDEFDNEIEADIKDSKKEKKKLKKDISRAEKTEKKVGADAHVKDISSAEKTEKVGTDSHVKKEISRAEKTEKKFKNQDKSLSKEAKKLEKEARKNAKNEEKQLKKEQKKLAREEKKAAKLSQRKVEAAFSMPNNITTVYLDGNNMLFVLGALRSRVLRRKSREAEEMLEAMARSWLGSLPQLKKVILMFDQTSLSSNEENFVVTSARPNFPTSDHALIHFVKSMNPADASSVAIFTSDRALTEELVKYGVSVFKSKCWFRTASQALKIEPTETPAPAPESAAVVEGAPDADKTEDLDSWADKWLAQNFAKMNM